MRVLLGALALLCFASASWAEPVSISSVGTRVACVPAGGGSLEHPPSSCSENGVNADANATFTTFSSRLELEDNAAPIDRNSPLGAYSASSSLVDSVRVIPNDRALFGQAGTIQFTFDINGFLSSDPTDTSFTEPSLSFQFDTLVDDGNGASNQVVGRYAQQVTLFDPGGSSLGPVQTVGQRVLSLRNRSGQSAELSGTVTAEFDIVFGEYLTYLLRAASNGYQPNQLAEILPGSGLSQIFVFDEFGNQVGVNLLISGSFVNLNPFLVDPVPVPAALPLFASAMALLGWLGWRRRQAEPRQA